MTAKRKPGRPRIPGSENRVLIGWFDQPNIRQRLHQAAAEQGLSLQKILSRLAEQYLSEYEAKG